MNKKKCFIYVDVLGFESKAKEIAEKIEIQEDITREIFLSIPLQRKIEFIGKKGLLSKGISEIEGSDNYVLIVDEIQEAFEVVGELIKMRYIPLEIGLNIQEIDEDIDVEPINRKETIDFLKNDIINPYREYYKTKHGHSVKDTFVLFTEKFFDQLEPLDKKYCEKISYGEKTFFAADIEKIQQRCKIFVFLRKIGYPDSKLYGRIDTTYIPPTEYEDIERTLEKKRTVFVTGTAEYGKTYTAIRLMWEYYIRGYEPKWIKGGELTERIRVRKKLENIGAELKPEHVIYFEDPFGKTKYEKREGLEREIGRIIDTVKQIDNVYVIITSREEVFKEFEKEKLSANVIKEFERSLNLKKPSYDYEKRKEILEKWAEKENCEWLKDENLKTLVFESIKNKEILPTPLSLRDFAIATVNENTEKKLRKRIKEKSEETARAFSKEIKNMSNDKIIFMLFLFISEHFEVDFVKLIYGEAVKKLDLVNAWEFDRILSWFENDKIHVGRHIEFSHPSYSEALKFLLVENGCITKINEEIFSKLLFVLAEKEDAAEYVAQTIAENYLVFPDKVRNLLFRLSERDRVARSIVGTVTRDFNKFPDNVRNELLFKLSEKVEVVGAVARIVAENFSHLPENVRNELLLRLSEKEEAVGAVARIVARNFSHLPENVRNLLFKLSEKDETAEYIARVIAENFSYLPDSVRNLLFKLSEKDETAKAVAYAITENFSYLPREVRSLLFKICEEDKKVSFVEDAVIDNLLYLPEEERNELLLRLSEIIHPRKVYYIVKSCRYSIPIWVQCDMLERAFGFHKARRLLRDL